MILTVTPNPALDVSYELDRLAPGESLRVVRVGARAGGKGVNVARVAAAMGRPVFAMGLLGGTTGEQVEADLGAGGVPHHFLPGPGETRTTVNIHARGNDQTTLLNEEGPATGAAEWARLVQAVRPVAHDADVGVVSGSLPPGLTDEAIAELLTAAPTYQGWIVDARGPALMAALAAGPAVVKPNLAELRETVEADDVLTAARALQRRGARLVVVSDGPRGIVAVHPDGRAISARLPKPLRGNATGAGDALSAGIADGLREGLTLATLLRRAVAWSAAAVLAPLAGSVDPDDVARLEPTVILEEMACRS